MAWWAWGSATSTTCAPEASSASTASRKRAMMPASTPFSRKDQGMPTRRPPTPPPRAAAKSGTGRLALVASRGSQPKRADETRAASSTVRVKGPTWSRDEAKATRP